MLDKIKETKRKFNERAMSLLESDGHTFEDALNFFLEFCESDEIMKTITSALKDNRNIDFTKWHDDFLKSGGSMVGSGRFVLPTSEEDRLSLLYQLLLNTRSGKVNYDGFCVHAFGSLTFDGMAYNFNKAVSRPLIRGLFQRVEALEAKELPKQPTTIQIAPTFTFVLSKLEFIEWKDARRELDRALKAFDDGRMADCCNNLRMGLMIAIGNIFRSFEGKQPPAEPGKTTDLGPMIRSLREHGYPDDAVSLVRQTWSYLSERAHIDKAGKTPPEHEVMYGLQVTFSSLEYLLRTLDLISGAS